MVTRPSRFGVKKNAENAQKKAENAHFTQKKGLKNAENAQKCGKNAERIFSWGPG
jgi:hypothetical protein